MSEFEVSTFERCPHDAENPYAMISRTLIRDQSISPECRWMLIFLLSNSDGWVIKFKQLHNHVKGFKNWGRDLTYQYVDEAMDAGYMRRDEYMKNNLKRYRYIVSETPKFKKCFRCPELQDTGTQYTAGTDTLKNNHPNSLELVIKDNQKEREEAPPPPFFNFKLVKMLQKDYDALIEKHGKELITDYIERLELYSRTHNKAFKVYTDHAAVVETWIRRDNKKKDDDPVENSENENRLIAEKVVENFPDLVKIGHIELQKTGILFQYGRDYELIEFKDIEFREDLMCRLALMNLKME